MDYYSGGDLRYHYIQKVKFNEEQSSKFNSIKLEFIIACLILALEYLHTNFVIHRDLKPENIIFDKDGFVYLTDLGVSKIVEESKMIDSSGTPGYMSPETINNQDQSFTSDYFSLGVISHELMLCKVFLNNY